MTDTLLTISGIGVPPYSARGLTQTLTPIAGALSQRRSVNGELIDLSVAQLRKYQSTISCTDQNPPSFAYAWPGLEVEVDCVTELCYPATPSPSPLPRPVVSGSEREEDGFVFFRPRLTMLVTGFSTSTDEYGHLIQWQLQLEET